MIRLRMSLVVTVMVVLVAGATPYAAAEEVDVRGEVIRFSKAFAKAKTAEDRMQLVESLPDETGDPKIVKALIEALEKHLRIVRKVQKELDKAREKLAPYIKKQLLDSEWKERDRLEAEVGVVGAKLGAEDDVALAIVDKLVQQESEEVIAFLADWGLRNRSWRVRSEVIQALGRMRTKESLETVVIATRDKDPRVRQIAVEQAARMGGDGVDDYLIARLTDEEWPVKAAAIAGLAKLRSEAGVGPIILLMGEERGRLRDDCARALEEITGQTFGMNVKAWRDWWVVNHDFDKLEAARFPRLQSEAVSFHEVKTSSMSIMYVVDISDSMNEDASSTELTEEGRGVRTGVDRSKFDVMVKELVRTIGTLPQEATFNIIVYNHEVRRWKDKMQTASKKSKNEALEFLFSIEALGGTNIFDSLELAFESAGLGAKDRYYKPLVDTIYFLSDGAPSTGRITDTKEILREIDRMNRFRRITIHSIGVGKLHDKEFMKRLADAHGGAYVQRL